jgi:hypothetical protein
MEKFDEYLNKAKSLAESAGEMAKNAAGEVASKAKELKEEDSKVKELMKSAKEEAAAYSMGAREKVQDMLGDARAGKELKLGIAELDMLPEFEGSIVYSMEFQSMRSYLNSLYLIICDNRLDEASAIEEINKVMEKVKPAADLQTIQQMTEEEKAIEKVRSIAYDACVRAMAAVQL